MKMTAAQKVAVVALVGSCFLLFLAWRNTVEKEFETTLRRTVSSDVGYLILCEIRGNPRPQPCQTIHGPGNSQFTTAIRHLSEARSASSSNKEVASDKILKIGRGSPASKEYLGCYRVTKYVGLEQIYISPIETDRECTWPDKYRAGTVAIPGDAFGRGAI
jgi:hypothetical protein